MMGSKFIDIEMEREDEIIGMERRKEEMLRDIKRGNLVEIGNEL